MANKLLLRCLRPCSQIYARESSSTMVYVDQIGNRDVVGYGHNGTECYIDRPDYPFPSVRFKANNPTIMALREKEKGDWKKLSLQEKKELYRASFCQTLVEVQAPTGEWKGQIGTTLLFVALTIWSYYFLKHFAYSPLPKTFDDEHRLGQLERMKILEMNPIAGLSSQK